VAPANTTSAIPTTFSAPASVPANASVSLTATSLADPTKSASAVITIVAALPNPVPFLNQPLLPDAVVPGGAAFSLTVNGTGFVSNSAVYWNGSARKTLFVSNSQLKAGISAADIAGAATAAIAVRSPSPGGGTSNTVFLEATVQGATVAFASSDTPAGNGPSAVAVGDFNGDGKLDLAVTNNGDNTVSVLLGKGDGTFAPAANYATGSQPFSVATGDFDGDGNTDLAVANVGETTVSVFLGKGDGTFKQGVTYQAGNAARTVVVGDFNGDGKLDLAVANQTCGTPGCGPGVISILLGNGDGTFQTHSDYLAAEGPTWMVAGDFNQDGFLDLAVTGGGGGSGNQLSVLLGNGDGTFQAAVNYPTDTNPAGIAAGDFNKDGKLDLVVANNVGSASVLLGKGDGTFQPAVNYSIGGAPIGSIGVADFNGDGNLDFAIADGANNAFIFLGNGDGTFQAGMPVSATSNSFGVAVGDFNQDGRLDLAVPNQGTTTVTIALQTATVTLSVASLDFGGQALTTTSASQPVTVTNSGPVSLNIAGISLTGTNPSDFGETNNCNSTLASGAHCTVNVSFTPGQVGPRSASLSISDSAMGSPQSVALSGSGLVTGPNITLSTSTLTFPTQLVHTTSSGQGVTLTNYGTSALGITGIAVSGNFGQTNNCPASLPSVANCTINVTFTPATAGSLAGTLSITDNVAGSPQTISLSGVGTFVELSPAALAFGAVKVNASSSPKTTVLTNTGSGTLAISSISFSGAKANSYSQTNTCGTSVAAGASCNITVTFHPLVRGAANVNLLVADSDPGSPQAVQVTGTGFTKRFALTASSRRALVSRTSLRTPTPTGNQPVGSRDMDLVDFLRPDPYLANGTKRELLVRFWYPASPDQVCQVARYTSPAVWNRFSRLFGVPLPQVETASCMDAPAADGLHPIVILTHGYTGTFTDYTFLCEDLASRGYIVASVDHTYEATAVEFPDGRLATSLVGSHLDESWKTDDATLRQAVSVRLEDLRFILNQLERMNSDPAGPFLNKLDVHQIALAGHSLGGLTALLGIQQDTRFRAGILLDPYLADDVSMPTVTPVLLLAAGRTEWSENEIHLWNNLAGPRLAVDYPGAEHSAPSDAIWLASGAVETGKMSEEETVASIRDFIAAFLDANLRGKPADSILLGSSPKSRGVRVTTQTQMLGSLP
jgi:dienelactone hydrolase